MRGIMSQETNELVLTLITSRESTLTNALVQNIASQIDAKSIKWLADNEAADLFCASSPNLMQAVKAALADLPIDALIQPVATRRKRLLLADMESTIIEQELLDELAETIGLRDQVSSITHRAMNGELDFSAALRERVALLKAQPVSILESVLSRITFVSGAQTLINTMQANNGKCWLASGGFTFFTRYVARQLGFDAFFGNDLMMREGLIAGEVAEPIFDKEGKKSLLVRAQKELNIPISEILSVGDGANDTPMLAATNEGGGLGVAYHAKPQVRRAIAPQINYADLTALLYAQGYAKHDFQ